MTWSVAVEETEMDPRRDYPNFTDAALDFFIRRFPSHPDHAAALAEVERRRKTQKQRVEPASGKVARVDTSVLIWALGGIVILALVILFLLLPIAMARTSRKPPTSLSESSAPVQELSTSANGLTDSPPSPETSRQQLHRGQK
jgi:hypothetical protein